MARNIFRDYIEYDKKVLKDYINTITAKKINNKVCNMIVNTYVDLRYFNTYEPVKKNLIDSLEYHVIGNYLKDYAKEDKRRSLPNITDALIILRYVVMLETESDKKISKYEEGLKNKYENTGILVNELIKKIKDNIRKKEKYIDKLASEDFSLSKKNTEKNNLYELFLDNSIKMPDLYSDIAISRVYNTGVIYEDRMLVAYLLTVRELLIDSLNGRYDNKYMIEFPSDLLNKRNKLANLLRIIENDYLKERMILKIKYSDYKKNKEQCDKLIHEGYSFAVIIDGKIKDNLVLLNIFTYILLTEKADKTILNEFDNAINI